MTQGKGDVNEHDGVADYDGADVTVAFSCYFVFNAPLCTECYGQVGVAEVLHEFDKSERHTHTKII